jgi:DNA-binding response OmpR family regulator
MDKKILVVDDDETTRIILEKHLTKNGYEVVTSESAISAAELLKKSNFAVVMTDINMPEVSGLDFLLWIKKHEINTKVIMMTSLLGKDIEIFANKKGAVNFFRKPIDVNELDALIYSLIFDIGFSGKIEDMTLFDFIQMMVLSNKEKRLSVFDPFSNKTGYLYVKNNNIAHAEIDDLSGEQAFYKIMKIKKGVFADTEWLEPKIQTINVPYNSLLMEAAKIIDDDIASGKDEIQIEYKPINKRILIVDDDETNTKIIKSYFAKKDYEIIVTDSAINGAELMKQNHFGVVITDLHMPAINGLEFLIWIKANYPKTHVVIMTSDSSTDVKSFANQNGALNYFEKPVDLKKLEEFITYLFKEQTFSGNVQDINLFDFIQVVAMSRKNKLISARDPITYKSGVLYMQSGNLVHAEFDNLQGEDAFFAITQLERGIFSEMEWVEQANKTIKSSLNSLLMKSMRLLDEKSNNEKIKSVMKMNLPTFDSETPTVKAEAKFLEKILAKKTIIEKIKNETDLIKKLTIYEFGVAMEIAIGRSDKNYVIETMKKYSNTDVTSQIRKNSLNYHDISVNIVFDERDVVEEIDFGVNYMGSTNCGVSIGDTIDKPIKVYGKPQLSTMRGYVWENIAFFADAFNIIETIRLRTVEI